MAPQLDRGREQEHGYGSPTTILHLPRLLEGFLLVGHTRPTGIAPLIFFPILGRLKEVVELTTPGGPLMKTRDRLLEETDHGQR